MHQTQEQGNSVQQAAPTAKEPPCRQTFDSLNHLGKLLIDKMQQMRPCHFTVRSTLHPIKYTPLPAVLPHICLSCLSTWAFCALPSLPHRYGRLCSKGQGLDNSMVLCIAPSQRLR